MKIYSAPSKIQRDSTKENQPFFSKKEQTNNTAYNTSTKQPSPFFVQRQEQITETSAQQETETTYTKGDYSGSFSTNDADKLIIKKGEDIKSNGTISVSSVRNKLVGDDEAQYTLNAVVKIAKYVGNNITGISYSIPTDLSGTTTDNIKILPDDIVLGIALLQANAEISIDGMPGPIFIKDVMNELSDETDSGKRKRQFMHEIDNDQSTTIGGEAINIPDFTSDEATLYDFFRNMTLARNGLWSDNENITNLTGLRRKLETTSPQWNDTIAVTWITKTNNEITKHAKIFAGTTEPGNLGTDKQLLPQTILFKLGYHKSRQPALRGHRTLSQTANDSLLFNAKDERGLNAHPGGTTGKILGMEQSKLPAGTVSTEEQFKANLIITEIFSILSRWGLDKSKTAYINLKDAKDAKELILGEVENNIAKVHKEGDQDNAKEIDLSSSKEWLAKYWVNTKKDRASLLKIIQNVDSNFEKPSGYDEMSKTQILALLTNNHIESIIEKQIQYFTDKASIDGKAGKSFLNIVDGKKEKITDFQTKATTDFERVEVLFDNFADNTVLKDSHKNYIKNQIKMQTIQERGAFTNTSETLADDQATQVNENVGPWSILCQVIFGPEKFYEFMMQVSDKSLESGQRRWYYTLIDLASITASNDAESGQTESGPVEIEK